MLPQTQNQAINGVEIPRFKMAEMGYLGLRQSNGIIFEEYRSELRWPRAVYTYKQMTMDATISAALQLIKMMIGRVKWDVDTGPEATETQKFRANFVKQCMDDMDHSWFQTICEICSMFAYGFSIQEKIYRRRYKKNGSKFDDGFVGIKALPTRSQDTIYKWIFSENGRDLMAIQQSLINIFDPYSRFGNIVQMTPNVVIPRNKFMLFRTNVRKDNPEGESPLASVYFAWKFRTSIEEIESVGIARDMRGLPVLELPARYMSADASDDEKAVNFSGIIK